MIFLKLKYKVTFHLLGVLGIVGLIACFRVLPCGVDVGDPVPPI